MSKVAVLLATYNGEKYVADQLDSLFNQTFKNFTCYIHDDGSTDRTVQICEEYEAKYPEIFTMLRYESTGGAKNNFLSLMKHVDADKYLFCDQDDVWLPDRIEKMMKAVQNLEGDYLAFSDLKIVDEKLNILSDSFYSANHVAPENIDYKNALIKGFIPGCTMMANKNLVEKALRFQNADAIKMHDWWLVLIALMTESRLIYVKESLGLYRQHSANTIGAKNLSTIDRILFNVKRVLSGTLRAEKKKNLETPRLQAKELWRCGIGSVEKLSFVKEFAEIGNYNKLRRMVFYLRNFHHVYRLWWMVVWA